MNFPPEIEARKCRIHSAYSPSLVEEFLEKYDRLLLDERGIIKLQSADFYQTLDYTDLRVWSICRAIYQLPTIELVEWLEKERWDDKNGKPESNAALVTRKLEKMRSMEHQGY